MLHAIRPHNVCAVRPTSATVAQLSELGHGPEDRKARLSRVGTEAPKWGVNFCRCTHAGRPAIILAAQTQSTVAAMKRIWVIGFANAEQRGRLFDWIGHRVDRGPF